MEAVSLTYLEVLDLIQNGMTLFTQSMKVITPAKAADMFFLTEDTPQMVYM